MCPVVAGFAQVPRSLSQRRSQPLVPQPFQRLDRRCGRRGRQHEPTAFILTNAAISPTGVTSSGGPPPAQRMPDSDEVKAVGLARSAHSTPHRSPPRRPPPGSAPPALAAGFASTPQPRADFRSPGPVPPTNIHVSTAPRLPLAPELTTDPVSVPNPPDQQSAIWHPSSPADTLFVARSSPDRAGSACPE